MGCGLKASGGGGGGGSTEGTSRLQRLHGQLERDLVDLYFASHKLNSRVLLCQTQHSKAAAAAVAASAAGHPVEPSASGAAACAGDMGNLLGGLRQDLAAVDALMQASENTLHVLTRDPGVPSKGEQQG